MRFKTDFMKRICLLSLFLISLSFAQSQTLLYEDFESNFSPAGWTLMNGNTPAGYNWARNTDTTLAYVNLNKKAYPAFQGLGSMVYETDTVAAKAWIITAPLGLTRGTSYTITFYYAVFNADYPEKLRMTVGSAATIEAQNTVLWDNNGDTQLANDSAWTKATIKYTPGFSGNFYFGFNCYSDANRYALLVDNIKVEATPAAPPCAVLKTPADGAAGITAPETMFTWDSVSAADSYIFKTGTTNTPDSTAFAMGTSIYQSNLSYNTTYYWSVVPANSAGSASGCPVYSFTTQPVPLPPANDNCNGAIQLNAGSSVYASTKGATQSMPAESCNEDTGDANDDVWFSFTPLQSGNATIILTPDLMFDGVINAYSGTCDSLVNLACADDGIDGEPETLTLPDVTAGKHYYLRIYGYGNAGKDGSFTLAASGTALPVTITGFTGKHNGSENILSWTTVTEENNKGFELQHSAECINFAPLAFIPSKAFNGNTSSILSYQFIDENLFAGETYYRLKQIDKDGNTTFSNILLLKKLQPNAFALSNIYPNPARSFIKFGLTAPAATRVRITITDLAGKPAIQQSQQLAVGNNNLSLNISNLSAGSYIIKAESANVSNVAAGILVKQ